MGERRSGLPHLLAGLSAGVGTTMLLHPLDLIKIRLHVQEVPDAAQRRSYTGTVDAFRKILRTEGGFALYQGVTPNMLGSAAAWGSYFYFYDRIKDYMRGDGTGRLDASQHVVAATIAGTGTLLCTNPIWVVKTRMCLQDPTAATGTQYQYRSVFHGLVELAQTEGLRGLYRGLTPGLVGVSHGGLQFGAYEEMKVWFNQGREHDAQLSTPEYIFMAATSKVFAQTITYPVQVLRSRLQHDVTRSAWPECLHLYRTYGIAGFYKGIVPGLLRVTPATCTTFVLYEHLSRVFAEAMK